MQVTRDKADSAPTELTYCKAGETDGWSRMVVDCRPATGGYVDVHVKNPNGFMPLMQRSYGRFELRRLAP